MPLDDPFLHERREPAPPWMRRSGRTQRRPFWLALATWIGLAALLAWLALSQGWHRPRPETPRPAPTQRPAPTPPPLATDSAAPPPPAPAPRERLITKCVARDGRVGYADGPCPPGTTSGSISVRPDLNLADGMSTQARQQSVDNNRAIAQQVAEQEAHSVAAPVDDVAALCAQLAAQIVSIDRVTRQPLPGVEQDRWRATRRQVRDRQFALRCPQ